MFHLFAPNEIPASEMKAKDGGTLADYRYEFTEDGTYRVFNVQTPGICSECGTWYEKGGEYFYDNSSLTAFPNRDFAKIYEENGNLVVSLFGMKLYLKND